MFAGTLVTAIGFMPNGFAKSTAGEYAGNMFWIVGIALIASGIVAVVFTPYLGVKLLPNFEKHEGGHGAIYATPNYERFRRLLGSVIRRKWLVAAGVIGAFAVAVLGMGVVNKQFFPTSDRPEVHGYRRGPGSAGYSGADRKLPGQTFHHLFPARGSCENVGSAVMRH